MSYPVNPLIDNVNAPPIANVHGWVAGRDPSANEPLLDVAQAVPTEPPSEALRRRVAEALVDDGLHRYTPITGLPELRTALSAYMNETHAVSAATAIAADDVVITAGCNQAFCAVLQALAGPGDEIVLPLPFYFTHVHDGYSTLIRPYLVLVAVIVAARAYWPGWFSSPDGGE